MIGRLMQNQRPNAMVRDSRKCAAAYAANTGLGTLVMPLCKSYLPALIVTAILSIGTSGLLAETFILKNGERLDGAAVRAIGGTISIKLPGRGMRQLPVSDVEQIEVRLATGDPIAGTLIGWSTRGYELAVDDRQLTIKNGEITKDIALREEPTNSVGNSQGIGGPSLAVAKPLATVEQDDADASAVEATASLPVLSVSSDPIQENVSEAVFRLTLSEAASRPVVAIYSVLDRAAKAGDDFHNNSGVATIGAGQTSVDVRVPIIDDDIAEADEEFSFFLSVDPSIAVIEDRNYIATIIDDDT